jgi:YVTN family beta-propeller protein
VASRWTGLAFTRGGSPARHAAAQEPIGGRRRIAGTERLHEHDQWERLTQHPATASALQSTAPDSSSVNSEPPALPNSGSVYVANSGSATVSVIAPDAAAATTTIRVGSTPVGGIVAPPGTANAGTVYIEVLAGMFGSGCRRGRRGG